MPFPQHGLDFLADLADNNSKAWMDDNRKRYEKELKTPARDLVDEVNEAMAELSPAHVTKTSKAISRINRDVRFSKDKTPYNTNVWAAFMNQSVPKGHGAGFYFGFDPAGCGVGAGVYKPAREAMTRLRSHIADHHQALREILADLHEDYGDPDGDRYKRVPKPWDSDHPAANLLKLKGLTVRRELGPDLVTGSDFVETILVPEFRRLKPLVEFVEAGLTTG